MSHAPEPLSADLAEALSAVALSRLGRRVLYFPETGSTNDVASALAATGDAEGTVVIADAQTAGRGRRGHTWFSPPGAGLYISVVLTPRRAAIQQDRATALLTMMAGVAIAEAIEQATGLSPAIKWPNDLLIGRRKLSGILAEGVHTPPGALVHAVVLGYGINVSPAAYPSDLAARVTSLESELGRGIDRSLICAVTLSSLALRYDDLLAGRYDAILDAWRRRAPGANGARVSFDRADGLKTGTTAGVDANGALLVNVGDRLERIVSGEVRWD